MIGRATPLGGRPRAARVLALSSALALALATSPAAADVRDHGAPSIRAFDVEDGLPQITVNAIAFEPGGRMWIGTQGGAASYDGRRFTPLSLPTGGASNWVQAIAATPDGAVWFGMISGHVFRYAQGGFTRFGAAEGLTSEKPVRTLLDAPAGQGRALWVGTADGLYRFEGERWTRVDLGPGFEHPNVSALRPAAQPGGEPALWVGTARGLLRCEDRGCARFATTAEGLPSNAVTSLLETSGDAGGRVLWAGMEGGVARYADGRWESFTPASVPVLAPPMRVTTLAETVSGSGARTLWAGTTSGGLARLQGGTWTTLTKASSGLPDDYVLTLAASGGVHGGRTLWIGTNAGGLARLRHDGWVSFTQRNAGMSGAISSPVEVRREGSPPELWVAVNDTVMRSSGQGFAPLDAPELSGKLGDLVTFLLPSAREPGVVWIGSLNHGLHRWADRQLTTYTMRSSPLPGNSVQELSASLDGRALWIATSTGAARLDAGGAWQVFTKAASPLPDDQVLTLRETAGPGGKVSTWFGTMRGLGRLADGQWRSYTSADAPLASDVISAFAELRHAGGARVLWIGTQGGVSRYDLDAETWLAPLSAGSRPALPDNSIVYGVRADAQGRIYLFTDHGVVRLTPRAPTPDDPAEFSAYTFTIDDGLPGKDCNQNGSFVDSQGRLWAGTGAGLSVLDPAEEVPDLTPKPLVLDARADGVSPALVPGASLAWRENTVSFDYTLLSFFRERDTRYRAQLVGFDAAPGAWTTNVDARYTNLPSGPYTFQVWGRDYAGNVFGPAAIAFQIRPAPWLTWWAYLGYAAALFGLVYGGVRLRLRTLARRNRELSLLVEQRTVELKAAKEAADAAREAADAANQAKTSFLASMSHELRTPLNGILGYAQLLQRSPRLASEDRSGVDVVRRSGEHLLTLIDDVLDLARIEAGRISLMPGDVHLPSLAQGVAELCRVRAAQKGLDFKYVQADGAPTWVRVDEKRLTQVLLNLVGNALKFTREGWVTLRVEAGDDSPEGRGVVFHVEDTGPGIAPADLARIFEPFEQAGDRRVRAEGAGLGLAITRRIVEHMGGRIEVQSAPGEGSTFTVALRLPVIRGEAPAVDAGAAEVITGYEGSRRSILVVDDHEDNRAFLRDALAPLGFEVLEAAGGEPAVALAAELRPDLVLMDLHMPDLGGDEAARRIRELPGLAELPIVATSASVQERERALSAAAGCDSFLPKPIGLGALLDLLERRLALTWIRRAPEPPRDAKALTAGPRIPPPPEVLARLGALVEVGRIQDLVRALEALEAEDPRLAPWITEARALAEGFRVRDLQALMAAPDPGSSHRAKGQEHMSGMGS